MTLADALAMNLKRIRIRKGYTQDRLSRASGVHRGTIANLEARYSPASFRSLRKLARTLGIEETDFFQVPASAALNTVPFDERRPDGRMGVVRPACCGGKARSVPE